MSNPEEPRFGQRSDSWSANPDPAQDASSATPWPQYGETPAAPQQSTPQAQGYPTQPQPQAPYGQQGAQPQGYQPTPQAAPYAQPAASGPLPELPGRGGSIALLIVGVLTMVIAAPMVFFGLMLGGMDLGKLATDAQPVANGSTVTVDSTGGIFVMSADYSTDTSLSCKLTDKGGAVTDMEVAQLQGTPVPGTAQAKNLTPGEYTIDCEGVSGGQLLALPTGMFENMVNGIMGGLGKGFLWATLVGLVGLGMFIGGIVWLVRTNNRRREIQRQSWMSGGQGGYGAGPAGGQPGVPYGF